MEGDAALYGICVVCGAPRTTMRTWNQGVFHLDLVCSIKPDEHVQ